MCVRCGCLTQAKAKKTLETLGDERRKREEAEPESVKADKARAKAYRDRLAAQAADRRSRKALDKLLAATAAVTAAAAHAGDGAGAGAPPGPNPLAGYVTGPNGMLYRAPYMVSCASPCLSVTASHTRAGSEVWGESDGGYSTASSRPGSRPISARSVDARSAGGACRMGVTGQTPAGLGPSARLAREGSSAGMTAAALVAATSTTSGHTGLTGHATGPLQYNGLLSGLGAFGSVSHNSNSSVSNIQIQNTTGGLPPAPFRGNGRPAGEGGAGGGGDAATGGVGGVLAVGAAGAAVPGGAGRAAGGGVAGASAGASGYGGAGGGSAAAGVGTYPGRSAGIGVTATSTSLLEKVRHTHTYTHTDTHTDTTTFRRCQ